MILEYAWTIALLCAAAAFGGTALTRIDGDNDEPFAQSMPDMFRYMLLALASYVGCVAVSSDIIYEPLVRLVSDVLPDKGTDLHFVTTWLIVGGVAVAVFVAACSGSAYAIKLVMQCRRALPSAKR